MLLQCREKYRTCRHIQNREYRFGRTDCRESHLLCKISAFALGENILRRCDCLRESTGADCSGNCVLLVSTVITASNNAITAIRAKFKYRIKRKLVAINHLKICSKMPDNLTSLNMDTTLSVVCFFQHVFWCNALV